MLNTFPNELPVYIAVPHQKPPYLVDEDYVRDHPAIAADDDSYFEGDHDLHSVCLIETMDELQRYADGKFNQIHQWAKVSVIAEELVEYFS